MQHDYNGSGRWSRAALLARYAELARRLRIEPPADLCPMEVTAAGERWVYPVMMRVIEGIGRGDAACVELGIAFIEEDSPFPFGRLLKSNTARALRRAALTPEQQERIRRRVIAMLVAGKTPREYREYAKLVRRIGVGEWWAQAEGRLNLASPYVRRYYDYFKRYVVGNEPSTAAPDPAA
ncbi:hypothetical protein R5W23_005656 [Gemmata sp. JC673]|uniref:Type I-E CRISPR-associated protein Cse2/CasB n=1 Tax=Gemmata algarum TaxID=2975278 RepID=A0ABU5EXX0_9BACT|nr:hypothetical protein [Gemmata algarum]MDY3558536.1 hypothetical protein [Gemmata algarum]